MIGTEIRSFHHLLRVVGNEPKKILFKRDNGNICLAEAITIKNSEIASCDNEETIYFFNNIYGDDKPRSDWFVDKKIAKTIGELNNKWLRAFQIYYNKNPHRIDNYSEYIRCMWVMPDSFDEDYEKFCQSNKKQFEIIRRKYCSDDHELMKFFYALCEGSKNYFFWAVAEYFSGCVSLYNLKRIIDWVNIYGHLSKKLVKGTVTGYTSSEEIHDLLNEIVILRQEKRINDIINSFNTVQKHCLKTKRLTDRDKDVLNKFWKLSSTKKSNFIRKMSTINDADEIMRQMAYMVHVRFEWDKNALINYITNTENLNAEIISVNGDIVLVKVNDYDAVKYLGKATNWCISKNKTYWNQYIKTDGCSIQYMIFDFSKTEDDKHSIIGFTSELNRGITNAHDFTNQNLMRGQSNRERSNLKSFLEKFNNKNGIFNILKEDNIRLSDVTFYDKLPYDWNKKSFIKYLNECVDHNNYEIIQDSDDKLALIINDANIRYFLGDYYMNSTNRETWRKEHIIFADFSLPENDPNKIIFGIVSVVEMTCEAFVNSLFNIYMNPMRCSFNQKLIDYNLPYDTIQRTDNVFNRFKSAIVHFDLPILRHLLDDEKLIKAIKDGKIQGISKDTLFVALQTSILNYHSFDLINLFYERGFTLTELMGKSNISSFFFSIYSEIFNIKNGVFDNMILPKKNDIEDFNNGCLKSYEDTLYIGLFLALNLLIEHEKNGFMFKEFCLQTVGQNSKCQLTDYLFTKASELVDYKKPNDTILAIMKYAFKNNLTDVISTIVNQKQPKIQELLIRNGYVMKDKPISMAMSYS